MATKKKTSKAKPAKKKAAAKASPAKKKPAKKKAVAKKKAAIKKAPAKKKPAAKKAVAKKKAPAKKKAAAKKAPAKKKAAAKKSPAKKKAAAKKKAPAKKKAAAKKAPVAAAPVVKKKKKARHLSAADLRKFQKMLLNIRERLVGEVKFLAGDNLNSSARGASGNQSTYRLTNTDQGTDNFDREFALNLVSSEQDIIYEIDEALRRIENKTYGICEVTEEPIEKARLEAIPHARLSIAAQSELEKGRTKYRPFGSTLTHTR
jgi:RNA polymerase-binding transcription factor DksA